MRKGYLAHVALVVLALSMPSSLLLGFAVMPEIDGPTLGKWAFAMLCAVVVSAMACAVLVAKERREERMRLMVVCLACLACAAAMWILRLDPKEGVEFIVLVARLAIFACYALACRFMAVLLTRWLGHRLGLAMHLAVHFALTLFCTYDTCEYALGISAENVAWMSLCWTLFALPLYGERVAGRIGSRRAVAIAAATFVATFLVLSTLDPLVVFRLPLALLRLAGRAVSRPDAVLSRMRLVLDWLADGSAIAEALSRIPITWSWYGVTGCLEYRIAYITLLAAAVACAFALWYAARRRGERRTVEMLALGVLLSNLWGTVCYLLSFESAGVGTLLTGNPFQLVPVACLIAAQLGVSRDGEGSEP